MNCQQAREQLIDLVYGELGEADRRTVLEHVDGCPACRAELADLRLARTAVARHRADEPAEVGRLWVVGGRAPFLRRLLAPAAAAAAVVVIGLAVWMLHETTIPAAGAAEPVEIKRLGVSLTILSEPAEGAWSQPAPFQSSQEQRGFRPSSPRFRRGWRGMALVRDQRIIRRLKQGRTEVRFSGVPAGILPDTVRLRSLDSPEAMTILEQNYQYDLASAAAVLKRYVDRPVTAVFKDGQAVTGSLLSFDDAALVLQPPGEGPRNISRERLRAITLAELPEGLLTKPTLVWLLQNRAAAEQEFEVAYLTAGLTWRVDYVLKLRPGRAERGNVNESAAGGPLPGVEDTADLVGYATVTNNSGVTYQDAQLKLLAGDVNLIQPPSPAVGFDTYWGFKGQAHAKVRGFQEKSFFEYHLYTLGRPTTIRDAETKQIELVSGAGLKLKRAYVYDRQGNPTAARVVSELTNSEANGLGKPLPKGVLRLYAPNAEGVETYAARTTIDHTPKDEKIRLPWGYAFDIACSFTETDRGREGRGRYRTWQYEIRNHKDYAETVTVLARVPKTTYQARCDRPWHVREVGLVEIDVPVEANSAATATFTHSYSGSDGGGLESPYDRNQED